mmetsp:Transcript_30520/g.86304  ORF Transcript_30520/g.86304 Transcript_30520/m.86304 type:complete len:205 (-) Transcript_30520:687-1301(-)
MMSKALLGDGISEADAPNWAVGRELWPPEARPSAASSPPSAGPAAKAPISGDPSPPACVVSVGEGSGSALLAVHVIHVESAFATSRSFVHFVMWENPSDLEGKASCFRIFPLMIRLTFAAVAPLSPPSWFLRLPARRAVTSFGSCSTTLWTDAWLALASATKSALCPASRLQRSTTTLFPSAMALLSAARHCWRVPLLPPRTIS